MVLDCMLNFSKSKLHTSLLKKPAKAEESLSKAIRKINFREISKTQSTIRYLDKKLFFITALTQVFLKIEKTL